MKKEMQKEIEIEEIVRGIKIYKDERLLKRESCWESDTYTVQFPILSFG